MHIAAALLWLIAMAMPLSLRAWTIVVDPGHGGKDAGASGAKSTEKAINLAVAKQLKTLIESAMPDATVVMTRADDTFIPLQSRADTANRIKADLFVSIHTNSIDRRNPRRKTINGASVYTLGPDRTDANLEVAMRENQAMKLEQDYSQRYSGFDPDATESYIMFDILTHTNLDASIQAAQAIQHQLVNHAGRRDAGIKQAPFWVLVQTAMPSVLVELDFICNPDQEAFLASSKGQLQLAEAICKGIADYRGVTASASSASEEVKPHWRIQFRTSSVRLNPSETKDVAHAEYYMQNGIYKYTCGRFDSPIEAQPLLLQIKKTYPEAFIIKMIGDQRVN